MRGAVAILLITGACAGTRTGPGGAEASASPAPARTSTEPYTAADVAFMQDMMVHHAQALEMARLVPDRTDSRDLRLLARRITESQDYEMGLMRRWLSGRGESVPALDGSGSQMAGMGTMAGMATPEQMADLADSEDGAFERLFLELMIRHHEGALVMLDHLATSEGAGLEPELFQLTSHVDADQRAEIARMNRMLNELQ